MPTPATKSMSVDEQTAATATTTSSDGANTTTRGGCGAVVAMEIDHIDDNDTNAAVKSQQKEFIASLEKPDYLDSLKEEPLRTLALEVTTTSDDGDDDSAISTTAAVRVERLEIGLRNEMLKRLQTANTPVPEAQQNIAVVETVGRFWKSALSLCWHLVFMSEQQQQQEAATSTDEKETVASSPPLTRSYGLDGSVNVIRKIPFLLLEDVLDSLVSLDQCRLFWNEIVQPSFPILFHASTMWTPSPTLHPCWLPFLKLSNKYIRRATLSSCNGSGGAAVASAAMSTLCSVFPLSEKSATRPFGSHNADHPVQFETAEEFESSNSTNGTAVIDSSTTHADGAVPDYSFYESFWKLQADLSNPNAIKVADFMQRLKSLITAMESNSTSMTATSSSTTDAASYQPKYLTSSRLLSIQLANDVQFQCHILLQVLIVISHLTNQVPALKSQLQDARKRAVQLLTRQQQQQQQDSSSVSVVDFMESLLSASEQQWRQWKKTKCQQDLDQRQSEPLLLKLKTKYNSSSAGRKRKRLDSSGPLSARNEIDDDVDGDDQDMTQSIRVHGGSGGGDDDDDDKNLLQSISRRMRATRPKIQDHLNDYVEALDPDAGIEAEYHPKNDALFCWKAVRLLSSSTTTTTTTGTGESITKDDSNAQAKDEQDASVGTSHLQDFSQISPSGDFEGLVREMYKQRGVDIPGEAPVYEQDELDDKEEEKLKEEEAAENIPKDDDDKEVAVKMEEDTIVDDKMDVVKEDETKQQAQQQKRPSVKEEEARDKVGPSNEASSSKDMPNGSSKNEPMANGGRGGNDRGARQDRSRSPLPDRKSLDNGDYSKPNAGNAARGGDNRGGGRASRGASPVSSRQASLGDRRNRSENDLSRRGGAGGGPQAGERGGGDRREDHRGAAGPDRRHEGPPAGRRGGGGGGPHVDRGPSQSDRGGISGGPHGGDRDDHRRVGGGGRPLGRDDRRDDRRMEERDRRDGDDGRRGGGGGDDGRRGGGGGGGGGGDDGRRGGDDRRGGGDRDWRRGGGRDHSRGRHRR